MSVVVIGKLDKLNILEKSKMDWIKYKDFNLGEYEWYEMDV